MFASARTGAPLSYAFAKKNGAAYAVVDVPAADLVDIDLARAGQLLSDGLHVIFVKPNNTLAYGDANLATGRVTGFRDGPFSALNPLVPAPANGRISQPVMSGDGLVLTYVVSSSNAGLDGNYQSRRASTGVPFPQSKKLADGLSDSAKYSIQGLSYDGLTAFVFDAFTTRVFTRADTGDEFTTDLTRSSIPGWQVGVADACNTLVTTRSVGGSQNQQIATLLATP